MLKRVAWLLLCLCVFVMAAGCDRYEDLYDSTVVVIPRDRSVDVALPEASEVPETADAPVDEPAAVTDEVEASEDPVATEEPAEESAAATEAAQEPAKAYLVVTAAGAVYEPIPLAQTGRITLRRGDLVNVIEVTPTSIRMAESTCDNQDCVEQGEVTLDNKHKRVLQNMIICLPNDVALELYTYEELLVVMEGWLGGQAE